MWRPRKRRSLGKDKTGFLLALITIGGPLRTEKSLPQSTSARGKSKPLLLKRTLNKSSSPSRTHVINRRDRWTIIGLREREKLSPKTQRTTLLKYSTHRISTSKRWRPNPCRSPGKEETRPRDSATWISNRPKCRTFPEECNKPRPSPPPPYNKSPHSPRPPSIKNEKWLTRTTTT